MIVPVLVYSLSFEFSYYCFFVLSPFPFYTFFVILLLTFIQVHARCYGEPEPNGSVLWLCNLCRPGATDVPPCCLCPLIGTSHLHFHFLDLKTSFEYIFEVFTVYDHQEPYLIVCTIF